MEWKLFGHSHPSAGATAEEGSKRKQLQTEKTCFQDLETGLSHVCVV